MRLHIYCKTCDMNSLADQKNCPLCNLDYLKCSKCGTDSRIDGGCQLKKCHDG